MVPASMRDGRMGDAPRLPHALFLGLAAAAVFVLVVLCFTPRFALWRGLDAHAGWFTPELNRAAQTMQQLEDPWQVVDNEVNAVLNWRLLFPFAAYYLGLPRLLYLLLPAIGCLLTLALLTHVFAAGLGQRLQAVAATALMATTSWFFTSTGWLAYFDSWYVGGLVLAAFVDSRLVLAFCCLLVPWIDERFVLGLPLVLAVRSVRRDGGDGGSLRDLLRDALVCAAALLPLLAIRVTAMSLGHDAGSVNFLRKYVLGGEHLPAESVVLLTGTWHGLRAAWVYVAAFVVFAASAHRPRRALAIGATVIGTYLLALATAADISRSMSLLLPAAIMGVLLVAQRARRLATPLLAALLLCNLAAPAAHVSAEFEGPIHNVFAELERARHPPEYLDPQALNRLGVAHLTRRALREAFVALDSAVRLDPQFAEALHNRGRVFQETGHLPRAREDYRRALTLMAADAPARPYTEKRLREVDAILADEAAPRD